MKEKGFDYINVLKDGKKELDSVELEQFSWSVKNIFWTKKQMAGGMNDFPIWKGFNFGNVPNEFCDTECGTSKEVVDWIRHNEWNNDCKLSKSEAVKFLESLDAELTLKGK